MPDKSRIRQIMSVLSDSWIATRHDLHQYPELSGEECKTARYLERALQRIGLDVSAGIGGYGISAILHGAMPGPTVVYRADMDALPIQDTLATTYAPFELGIKHACGHDVHMAIALGTAEVLYQLRDHLQGNIQFIFQPAEESLDGAQQMLNDGVFEPCPPQAVFALHVFPLPVGTIGLRKGVCLAGMQEWRVRFYAPAGNLAALQKAAIQALEGLSTVTVPVETADFHDLFERMKEQDLYSSTQFTSCWENGYSPADESHLLLLASMTDFDKREAFHAQVTVTLNEVCAIFGASFDLYRTFENPPLVNDAELIDFVRTLAVPLLGEGNVWPFRTPYPFAHEDLALYAAYAPTALIWLGTANHDTGIDSILHTAAYDVDERSIGIGVELMTHILLDYAPHSTNSDKA